MATLRRKAAEGLDKIPSNEGEWRAAIQKYGLQQRTLEDLCKEGRFSASSVTKEAFLTLRCIWPKKKNAKDAMEYIADLEYFFTEDHSDDAATLIKRDLLGLDKFKNLSGIICLPKAPRLHTPPKYSGTLSDGLGPFSILVNIFNQLQDRSIQTEVDAQQVGWAPQTRRYFDPMQSSIREHPSSPSRQPPNSDDFEMEDVDMDDVSDAPLPPRPSVGTAPVELEEEEPPRRTPTETLVTDFMVALLGGLASLVQPLSSRPLCIANSFETTYQFGPLRNTRQQQGEVQYRARVDGSIPFSTSLSGMLREAAIFEAKRAVRKESNGSIPVLAQQSMEHAAYIWKRHEGDQTWKGKRKTYHTFMVAQDHLQFHISIGTYDNKYLEYIFASNSQRVLPFQGQIPFLEIQELGPFDVAEEYDLETFIHIMLSFILWQLEQTTAKFIFKEVLG
ncbi:hypothetical protein MferCBS31731_006535 [Microsporum ferrugineum]